MTTSRVGRGQVAVKYNPPMILLHTMKLVFNSGIVFGPKDPTEVSIGHGSPRRPRGPEAVLGRSHAPSGCPGVCPNRGSNHGIPPRVAFSVRRGLGRSDPPPARGVSGGKVLEDSPLLWIGGFPPLPIEPFSQRQAAPPPSPSCPVLVPLPPGLSSGWPPSASLPRAWTSEKDDRPTLFFPRPKGGGSGCQMSQHQYFFLAGTFRLDPWLPREFVLRGSRNAPPLRPPPRRLEPVPQSPSPPPPGHPSSLASQSPLALTMTMTNARPCVSHLRCQCLCAVFSPDLRLKLGSNRIRECPEFELYSD